jgi:hypothetical protein
MASSSPDVRNEGFISREKEKDRDREKENRERLSINKFFQKVSFYIRGDRTSLLSAPHQNVK